MHAYPKALFLLGSLLAFVRHTAANSKAVENLPKARFGINFGGSKEMHNPSRKGTVVQNNLHNFTMYALNMAYIPLPLSTRILNRPLLSMDMERRHLGPTLQELRSRNQISKEMPPASISTQFLTSPSEAEPQMWRNSFEKHKKHLGPTLDDIVQMKKEQVNKVDVKTKTSVDDPDAPTTVSYRQILVILFVIYMNAHRHRSGF